MLSLNAGHDARFAQPPDPHLSDGLQVVDDLRANLPVRKCAGNPERCQDFGRWSMDFGSSVVSIRDIADRQVLYLTTIGRRTGLPREIEIWFVVYRDRFYLFAETGEAAAWVKNIRQLPEVTVRIGEQQIVATARVLDRGADRELCDQVAAIADRKYGWGDGLPVEITPFTPRGLSDLTIKPAEGR
jgi:deazaflavin-dependent oxidoreductase (nitroreductase family)